LIVILNLTFILILSVSIFEIQTSIIILSIPLQKKIPVDRLLMKSLINLISIKINLFFKYWHQSQEDH